MRDYDRAGSSDKVGRKISRGGKGKQKKKVISKRQGNLADEMSRDETCGQDDYKEISLLAYLWTPFGSSTWRQCTAVGSLSFWSRRRIENRVVQILDVCRYYNEKPTQQGCGQAWTGVCRSFYSVESGSSPFPLTEPLAGTVTARRAWPREARG